MLTARIAIESDGQTEIHATGVASDYATLCGLDGDDPGVGQYVSTTGGVGRKIDCPDCKAIIRAARRYREFDLTDD